MIAVNLAVAKDLNLNVSIKIKTLRNQNRGIIYEEILCYNLFLALLLPLKLN